MVAHLRCLGARGGVSLRVAGAVLLVLLLGSQGVSASSARSLLSEHAVRSKQARAAALATAKQNAQTGANKKDALILAAIIHKLWQQYLAQKQATSTTAAAAAGQQSADVTAGGATVVDVVAGGSTTVDVNVGPVGAGSGSPSTMVRNSQVSWLCSAGCFSSG